jgi:predicted nucleotidyltransferase
MAELRIEANEAQILSAILRHHLPAGSHIMAFGSRATGRRFKPHSDLDLVVDAPTIPSILALADLREALAESTLPFHVDLLWLRELDPAFIDLLKAEGLVEWQAQAREIASNA